MHGRKKVKRTEEYLRLQQAKVEKYCALKSELIRLKREKRYSAETLVILGKLLYISPDFTTLWNLRREILLKIEKQRSLEEDDYQKELKLTGLILLDRDYKSYGTWAHRAWVTQKNYLSNVEVLKADLAISARVLQMDLRNFHCWNYRKRILRYLSDLDEVDILAEEKTFLERLFAQDPSNYSAWQNLSKVIRFDQLVDEFQKCVNMFYTDPEDSSAWIFHRFLFLKDMETPEPEPEDEPEAEAEQETETPPEPEAETESEAQSEQEPETPPAVRITNRLPESEYCVELLEICDEDESKWPLVTTVQNAMLWLDDPRLVLRNDMKQRAEYLERKAETLFNHLETLCRVDPDRLGYYRDVRSDLMIKSRYPDLSATTVLLQGAQLTRMHALKFYPQITTIDLSDNCLVEIPSCVGLACPNLQKMVLGQNRIAAIRPSSFRAFPRLEVLDLRLNRIRFIVETLCVSQVLVELWIEGNPVKSLRSSRLETWKTNFPNLTGGDVVVVDENSD